MVGKAEVLLRKFAQTGGNPAAARDSKGWTALHLVRVGRGGRGGRAPLASRRPALGRAGAGVAVGDGRVHCACTPGPARVHQRVAHM